MGVSVAEIRKNIAAADPVNVLYMVLNVASSIGIVFVNKWVYQEYRFTYATTLTLIHFVITFLGLHLCSMMGVFQVKRVEIKKVIPLALSFCGFVVLTNISLRYNSVGFYQIAKVMTTPVIMLIQSYYYGITFDSKIKLSLVPICLGVIITTATDFQLNLIGFLFAAVAVLVTSFYQIWVGTKQKELQVSSMQLLYYQAPLSSVMLLFFIPIFDDISFGETGLWNYPFTSSALFWIILSGVIAFAVNLSIFLVIGRTSPVTYNVLGHFKLVMIILGGFLIFNAPPDPRNIFGIMLTLTGVFAYTHIKLETERLRQEASLAARADIVTLDVKKEAEDGGGRKHIGA